MCGTRDEDVSEKWVIGHEERERYLIMKLNDAVNERNQSVNMLIARHEIKRR